MLDILIKNARIPEGTPREYEGVRHVSAGVQPGFTAAPRI